jgi:hypothetical protein
MTRTDNPDTEPAYVFEDQQSPDDWHVQWTDDDGGCEMAIFTGPRARERSGMPSGSTGLSRKSTSARKVDGATT